MTGQRVILDLERAPGLKDVDEERVAFIRGWEDKECIVVVEVEEAEHAMTHYGWRTSHGGDPEERLLQVL